MERATAACISRSGCHHRLTSFKKCLLDQTEQLSLACYRSLSTILQWTYRQVMEVPSRTDFTATCSSQKLGCRLRSRLLRLRDSPCKCLSMYASQRRHQASLICRLCVILRLRARTHRLRIRVECDVQCASSVRFLTCDNQLCQRRYKTLYVNETTHNSSFALAPARAKIKRAMSTFTISSSLSNIKLFHKALQCLSKVSTQVELLFRHFGLKNVRSQTQFVLGADSLRLCCLNEASTAYVAMNFGKRYVEANAPFALRAFHEFGARIGCSLSALAVRIWLRCCVCVASSRRTRARIKRAR
jgi:hypothetical protein